MMRSASAALAGVALALGACQPDDEGAARARRGAEAAEPIEQPRDEPGTNADGDAESPEAVAPEIGRTFVFDCDGGVSFTARFGPGEMALWSPESLAEPYQVLSLARSGTRYEEGDTVFWSKGNLATIEIAGQRFVDCRSNPSKAPWADAKRRGATFRALGNEPAWYVEIFPDRLAIVTELGTNRTELAHEGPVVASGRTTYRAAADGREATVVIDRRACADSMSGEGFEAFATVSFENRTLLGCGRFL